MANKILVITGSPRKKGNTNSMAKAFAKGAEAKGKKVKIFSAAENKVDPCKACGACWTKDGQACAFDDAFKELSPLLEEADAVVFTSPIYWYTFTAQIKSAMDKIFSYYSENKPENRNINVKKGGLISCGGDEDPSMFDGLIGSYHKILGFLEWENGGILTVPALNDIGDVDKTDSLKKAEKMGADF